MNLLRGQNVKLYEKNEIGVDSFGMPVYEETESTVENVIISPTVAEDIVNEMQIYGKHSVYTLCIPKGDTHNWDNCEVVIWGKRYKQFGAITEYQDELVPLSWNKQVKVELYE